MAHQNLIAEFKDMDPEFFDAYERCKAFTMTSLERLYSLFGAGDRVDAVVSVGGHAYRQDLRQAIYRFVNIHLKEDARPIADTADAAYTARPIAETAAASDLGPNGSVIGLSARTMNTQPA